MAHNYIDRNDLKSVRQRLSNIRNDEAGLRPIIKMNDPDSRDRLTAMMPGLLKTMHSGLKDDLELSVTAMVTLANEVAKYDQIAADTMYEGIVKIAQGLERFDSEPVKTEMFKNDDNRKNAFGDYWRKRGGPISRY